jgi:hypothetical protein
MKKLRVLGAIIGMVILISMFPGGAVAQGGVWNSGFQLVNMDSSQQAAITITYYKEDGSVALEANDTIAAGESKTFYLPDVTGLDDGQYSVVVSSSTPLAAVTNLTNYGANMADSYPGFSAGASESNLPLIMRRSSWKSQITVQNTGAGSANVYIEFYAPGSSSPILRYPSAGFISIPPGASRTYDVGTSAFAGLGSNFVGSAKVKVDGSGSVAAIVQEFRITGYSLVSILPGSTTSGTSLLAPLVYNDLQMTKYASGLAWRSGIQVQNLGTALTNVKVTIKGTNVAGTWSVTKPIAPNSSVTFYLPSESAVQKDMYGSAVIESGQDGTSAEPIVAIVNTTKYGADVGMAYNAFVDDPALLSNKVTIPLAYGTFQQSKFPSGQEWRSGIQVMNVDSSNSVYLKATFTNANTSLSGGPWTVTEGPVIAGDSYTFYLPDVTVLPAEYYGSVEIEAVDAGGAPVDVDIVAIVNTTKYAGNFAMCYPGFNHD